MRSVKITRKMKFRGRKYVVITEEHFRMFLDRAFPGDTGVQARGGDCDGFCDTECSGDGGCRRSFGSSGSCGAICGNGSVYMEL